MKIDPLMVEWRVKDSSIFTVPEYLLDCLHNAQFLKGRTEEGVEPITVPVTIGYNIGEKLAIHIVELHNNFLRNKQ